MRFASLGSGSRGNGTLVENNDTCLLIDLGFTLKETERRLRRLSRQGGDISAILVTHEHADHIHGVASFARKYKTPVYLTPGTCAGSSLSAIPSLHRINCHTEFDVGSIRVDPVPVPHDAKEPCQYLFSSSDFRLGLLTDLGHITSHVRESYQSCDALLLECNYDVDMLAQGPYPWNLKQRVGGDQGHLSNDQAVELLSTVDLDRLRHLVLTHLSEKNNTPQLAQEAVGQVMADRRSVIHLAGQQEGLGWVDLSSPTG